ncbi:MAG: hypothetical protein K2L23_01630 [Odoribacter sp.]|nr:hypothetical protein [Odoribacter sp.]
MKKEDLRNLLRIEEGKSEDEVKKQFKEIADMLFQDFHIEKEGVRYDFLEVEFYFFSKEHPDFITYPRNTKAGEWFFHMSGVDISFESKKDEREGKEVAVLGGGILVRSILKEGEKTPITGPYKCVDELFDKFDAFGSNLENFPILKPNEKMSKEEIKACVRWIPPFTGNFDEVKKERKEKELSEKYKKEFDGAKFEELINEKYRYYRADFECMSVKNYPAQPKL